MAPTTNPVRSRTPAINRIIHGKSTPVFWAVSMPQKMIGIPTIQASILAGIHREARATFFRMVSHWAKDNTAPPTRPNPAASKQDNPLRRFCQPVPGFERLAHPGSSKWRAGNPSRMPAVPQPGWQTTRHGE